MPKFRVTVQKLFTKEYKYFTHAETEEEAQEKVTKQIRFDYDNYETFNDEAIKGLTWEGKDVIIATDELKEYDKNEFSNERN